MEVFGVLLIFIMPYLAGFILKEIMKQKETNQIETYLTGFFFLFFLQGLVFGGSIFSGFSFENACMYMTYVLLFIIVVSLILILIRFIPACKHKKKSQKLKKEEWILLTMMSAVFLLVIMRIFAGARYLREDTVLETVKTTIQTGTMYGYHPLTGQAFEYGLIASKKIITLPIYYAFLAVVTKIDPRLLLFVVVSAQTIIAAYFSNVLLISGIFKNYRKKVYAFELVFGLRLLSGDYFAGSASERLLRYGYAGDTICAIIMIPFVLYIIMKWYQESKQEDTKLLKKSIIYILQIALCLFSSVFITGIATGFLFLIITIILAAICCLAAMKKEGQGCN